MTYRALTQDEWDDPAKKDLHAKFDEDIYNALGPEAKPGDFDDKLNME
jgi:hypothetical protein